MYTKNYKIMIKFTECRLSLCRARRGSRCPAVIFIKREPARAVSWGGRACCLLCSLINTTENSLK